MEPNEDQSNTEGISLAVDKSIPPDRSHIDIGKPSGSDIRLTEPTDEELDQHVQSTKDEFDKQLAELLNLAPTERERALNYTNSIVANALIEGIALQATGKHKLDPRVAEIGIHALKQIDQTRLSDQSLPRENIIRIVEMIKPVTDTNETSTPNTT